MDTGGRPGFGPSNSPRYHRRFRADGPDDTEPARSAAPMVWAMAVLGLAVGAKVRLYRTAGGRCPYEAVPAGEFRLAYTALIAGVVGLVLFHVAWHRMPVGRSRTRRAAGRGLLAIALVVVVASYALLVDDLIDVRALHDQHSLYQVTDCYGQG